MSSKHVMKMEYTRDYGAYEEERVILFDSRDYTEEQIADFLHHDYIREESIVNKKLVDIPLQNYNNVFRSLIEGGNDNV